MKDFVEMFQKSKIKEKSETIESFMNSYNTSSGIRVTKVEIDKLVRKAKEEKIAQMMDEYGYIFCEDCKQNDCKPIDCSHDISVKECQESGKSELAWDVNNITMRGRKCHQKHDKTFIGNG